MDMVSMAASFPSQDQAERAVRKLAALRADRFRMERLGGEAGSLPGDQGIEASGELGEADSAEAFSLSVQVPAAAARQARTVIEQAGGQVRSEAP
ncbi:MULTISPECIES: hypothetical protein [Cohnella]|uniref:hypothetical protein n=1 Tax=Cohnella TaxID=329857 RepID=UPI0009BBAC04|nr:MULTISPECIES: hypothetical protein [Cohnella]MBN2983290.1 hypothetical protein [Cohnella algarum]